MRGVDVVVARGDARVLRRGENENARVEKRRRPVPVFEKPRLPASFGVARDRGESERRRR